MGDRKWGRASQLALVAKNLPANAEDLRDMGSTPGSGRFPWRRKWQATPVFLPGESPWTEEPGGLQSELDTTEHTHAHMHTSMIIKSEEA